MTNRPLNATYPAVEGSVRGLKHRVRPWNETNVRTMANDGAYPGDFYRPVLGGIFRVAGAMGDPMPGVEPVGKMQ